jgi:Zn-dependent M28 family amino/carboxypeptidase
VVTLIPGIPEQARLTTAGVAAAMEAVRILQALRIKPRRTIRIGLWSGEEQALFGSEAYVAKHFGKPDDSQDANFLRMIQGGTAQKFIRGRSMTNFLPITIWTMVRAKSAVFYLQGNEGLRPLFRDWLQPFRDLGSIDYNGCEYRSTDHVPFDRDRFAGLSIHPGSNRVRLAHTPFKTRMCLTVSRAMISNRLRL